MATVWIPPAYKSISERLVACEKPLFPTYMDLFLFAAVVGFSAGQSMPEVKTKGGSEINSQVFHNNNKIGVVYLMAIAENNNLDLLKEGRDRDCFDIIQGYANGGLFLMQQWFSDSASIEDEEVLLEKINSAAQATVLAISPNEDDSADIDITADL